MEDGRWMVGIGMRMGMSVGMGMGNRGLETTPTGNHGESQLQIDPTGIGAGKPLL